MIQLLNVTKHFNNTPAVIDINLNIEESKTTVLIGPSGCGKSTLLRIITGLIKDYKGDVKIDGEVVDSKNILKIRRKLGYVIQDGGLFPHLTAYENISIMALHGGIKWEKNKIEERINYLSAITKFPQTAIRNYPGQLSGGQKQRVSLMRALMLNPDILILDEPLGALDPLIRYDLQTDLKEIFNELNKTVLIVTHDLGEAAYFSDKIVLMREGRIVQEDTIEGLINNPKNNFVEKFIKAQRIHLVKSDEK